MNCTRDIETLFSSHSNPSNFGYSLDQSSKKSMTKANKKDGKGSSCPSLLQAEKFASCSTICKETAKEPNTA